jgi:polysaccharide export outer membrane protein
MVQHLRHGLEWGTLIGVAVPRRRLDTVLAPKLPPGLAIVMASLALLTQPGCATSGPPENRAWAGAQPHGPLVVPPRLIRPSDDYQLGPRDIVTIQILDLTGPGHLDAFEQEVSQRGQVVLPFVGPIVVAGKSTAQAQAAITSALTGDILVNPQVTLEVKEFRSHEISVMGAVAKPGVIALNRNQVTIVEALALAGGLSSAAGTMARVLAPKAISATADALAPQPGAGQYVNIDLVPLLLRGDLGQDLWIEPGTVVEVPIAETFAVSGWVHRPGTFPYQAPTTVYEALALAGGLDELKASRSKVTITRPRPGAESEVIPVDLDAIMEGKAPDPPIFARDTVYAGRTWAWAIYTEIFDRIFTKFGAGYSLGGL